MLGRTGLRSADRTLPPGALVTFLQKGLQYIGIEESLRGTGQGQRDTELALLSPPVISAISRENPPIQLNVPAASAAAAVRARLEARLQSEHHAALSSQLSVNGPLSALPTVDPMSARVAQAAAAAQAVVAMSHLQQHMGAGSSLPPAAAAGLTQRSASDLLVLQQQPQQPPLPLAGFASLAPPEALNIPAVQGLADIGAKRSSSNAPKKSSKKQKKEIEAKKDSGATPMEVDETELAVPRKGAEDKKMNGQKERNGASASVDNGGPSEAIEASTDSNVPDEEILRLEMHQSEVFMCAWNPVYTYLIATGSGDASARIWHMRGTKAKDGLNTVKLLPHGTDPRDRKNKDVTTLEWSPDGTLLATGSYDGVARVWARSGALIHTLRGHNGPIFSLKWNKQGNYLLSGSYDKTTIVWDVAGATGFVEQQFTDHEAPALDVDWKDNTTFASCSTDKTVHICKVGSPAPIKIYKGHQDEVNGVKWDPSGKLLASCSDDCTAKVWDVESDRSTPLYDFQSHQQEIYTVKWSPTGPGSKFPDKKAMLATASFDGSVRLWDVTDGSCFRVFNRHQDSVYSVAFSPSGDFLASGSLAGQMYIWNIEEGRHIKSYKGKGDIFEVAWNKEETRVAACFSSNVVAVIDFQRPQS